MIQVSAICVFFIVLIFALSKPTGSPGSECLDSLENLTFTFDCSGKAVGFYADQDYNCQIFHMCNEEGKRIPHVCANETSFNQEFRICDWEYNFDCSEAQKWYYLNELTYVTDFPQDDVSE